MLTKRPDLQSFIKNLDKNNLPLLANEIKVGIIKRTQKGLDINLKPFRKYSKNYSEWKAKEYGKKVNLTVTQNMLNSITWRKIPEGIEFYFVGGENNKKAYDNQVKFGRVFFNIDKNQKNMIKTMI